MQRGFSPPRWRRVGPLPLVARAVLDGDRTRMSSLEMRLSPGFPRLPVAAGLAVLALVGCATEAAPPGPSLDFPSTGGKTDVFGRSLAGIAAPYEADRALRDAEDRLRTDAAFRRETAWSIVARAADQ